MRGGGAVVGIDFVAVHAILVAGGVVIDDVDEGRHACTGNRSIISPQSSHSRSHIHVFTLAQYIYAHPQ